MTDRYSPTRESIAVEPLAVIELSISAEKPEDILERYFVTFETESQVNYYLEDMADIIAENLDEDPTVSHILVVVKDTATLDIKEVKVYHEKAAPAKAFAEGWAKKIMDDPSLMLVTKRRRTKRPAEVKVKAPATKAPAKEVVAPTPRPRGRVKSSAAAAAAETPPAEATLVEEVEAPKPTGRAALKAALAAKKAAAAEAEASNADVEDATEVES